MRASSLFALSWVCLAAAAAAQTSAPATPAPLLPVPDNAAQAKARDMIHNIFKEDFTKTTPAGRQALARRLVAEGASTKDDAAARYVLFSDGADMAANVGDPETAMKAIAELGKFYKVDLLELQRTALLHANGAVTTPDSAEILTKFCLETADAAALADAFDIVPQLTNLAEAAANKTRKVALVAGIQTRLADLRSLTAEYVQVKTALDILTKKTDDAAAHTIVGRFYALHKGQWELGLPHLAQGVDPDLRTLAAKELAAGADGLEHTALGDAWWDFAEKTAGMSRVQAGRHAVMWYQRSEKSLSGITRSRIETRLKEGLPALPETAKAGPKPPVVVAVGSGAAAGVNLLSLIDPAKDAAEGKWSLDGGVLTVSSGKYCVLQLPYFMPDEYDLRVAFTRTDGDGPINLLLAAHKKAFGFALDVKGEARFERVGNKIAKDNPTAAPVVVSNGRRYLLVVQIRKDQIRALLDDKLVTQWKTDFKDLARYALWKMTDEKLCGLGANGAKVTFHSVEVVEVTGVGKAIR